MKLAFIMRGIPGSGKSTVARLIAGQYGAIHSTDDLRTIAGEYRFDPAETRGKHDENFWRFCESVHQHIPVVICDNTNVQRWEYERYIDAARGAGYLVSIVTLPHPPVAIAAERNTHGVPRDAIVRMLERWEA